MDAARTDLVNAIMKEEPKNWRLSPNVTPRIYSEAWANEILPVAREAQDRLNLGQAHPMQQEDGIVAVATAQPKTMPDGISYGDWAAKIARDELHKAGWRLADLLERCLK